jgi:hypothetical protein
MTFTVSRQTAQAFNAQVNKVVLYIGDRLFLNFHAQSDGHVASIGLNDIYIEVTEYGAVTIDNPEHQLSRAPKWLRSLSRYLQENKESSRDAE